MEAKTWQEIRLDEILHTLRTTPDINFLGKRNMDDIDEFCKYFTFGSKRSHKLQARIVGAFKEKLVTDIERDLPRESPLRAHWKSRCNPHSAAPWKAYPLTKELLLSDDDAKFMLQYATGAPTSGLPKFCSCQRILNLEHADTAKLQRHNMLQHRLVAFAREQAVTTKQNERFSLEQARKRQEPDIVFYFGSETWETDVTVVNPCAPTRLLQTLSKPGAALAARCNDKNRKYHAEARKRGHNFSPLGFETHGRFGQPLLDLLTKFAGSTPDEVGYAVADMVLDLLPS